jgi:hypothetical protein
MTDERHDNEPEFEFSFDVTGPYHIELRDGAVWVESEGLTLEMTSMEHAQAFIKRLIVDHDQALTDYLMGDLEEI